MKKAAEKSAVRWSCVVWAAIFFLFAASAVYLRQMQADYGCAMDDKARQAAVISGLIDQKTQELSTELRTYFESGAKSSKKIPNSFRPEFTNFRFCAYDEEGREIWRTLNDEETEFNETKMLTVQVRTVGQQDAKQLIAFRHVKVECGLGVPLKTDDVFSRTLSLMHFGASVEDILWAVAILTAAASLAFCAAALRGAIREAGRTKGAERLFNALPPDLYVLCVLPALVLLYQMLLKTISNYEILTNYLNTGSGEYRFLLWPACLMCVFVILLILLMLLVFSIKRGGIACVFTFSRFKVLPFPRRVLLYLLIMQAVKAIAIALYLTANENGVIAFLLIEKLVTLPVIFRTLRQLRSLMDKTAQFVQGDLSGTASQESDYMTLRMHGADIDTLAQRISAAANEYVQSSKFKAELITNLSHDIKTPLTSIINYAQLLRRDDLTQEDRRKYIEVLQRHSGRLQKLVEDLSEVSAAASGNVSAQMMVIDLCSLMRKVPAGFEERLRNQDISVRFYMPSKPVFVTADPRLLQRVTDNLMNNICKYACPGSEVQIAVVDGKSSVAAVFRNRSARPLALSGEELMERFVREDSARHSDGSGLGLSIAQSLMQVQDGKLWLHTEGDVFTSQILFRKSKRRNGHAK